MTVADDFETPLGKNSKKRKSVKLPLPQIIAGVLALSVVVVGLWTILADDPLGGEPIAVVNTRTLNPANTKDENVAAATARKGEAAPTMPAVKAIESASAPPAGSKVITIIDGSSGKKQDVVLPGKSDAADPKAPKGAAGNPALLEQSRHGSIPKIGSDGTRPSVAYAKPVKVPLDGPRIAIVVGGLGISTSATATALDQLPAPVTLAFTPYATDLESMAGRARVDNHEVMLQAPMEPFDYPDNDPGPQTLLTSLSADQNIDRLQWLMSRMQGYVGIAGYMGARFTASETALAPALRETAKRGLIFFDDGASTRSIAGQVAGSNSLPFAKADVTIDVTPSPVEVDRALTRLELMAREKGLAVGYASALPGTITKIAAWAKAVQNRGFTLVPVSMAVGKPKSS